MNEIDAVIFDMDGVLIDAREWHFDALNEALAIFGYNISLEDHLSRFDGLSTLAKLSILTSEIDLPVEIHELISAVKQDRTLRIAAQRCYPNVAHQILISRLKSLDIKVAVVTNSIRKTTEFMLEYAGLLRYLDVVVTNEDVLEGKPSPEGYLMAMKQLGAASDATLVIEDGVYGIAAAQAAGATVIPVRNPAEVGIELLISRIPRLG
jgi:HAD superfamily hydrolase (TIGR01509 family)